MIRIEKDGTTTFVVTLTELTTISNPEYLFEFVSDQLDKYFYCILTDESSATDRYNKFTIIDGTDVSFTHDGDYTYNVYEQANGSGNLDPSGLNRVEHGRAKVYIVDSAEDEYSASITNTVYNE